MGEDIIKKLVFIKARQKGKAPQVQASCMNELSKSKTRPHGVYYIYLLGIVKKISVDLLMEVSWFVFNWACQCRKFTRFLVNI